MFIVESYAVAIIMCFITMICWGSWANTTKLVSNKKWEFPLFYWDYSIGLLLCSLLFAFTLGSMGEAGRSFIPDIQQASSSSLMSAILAGIIFNISNILLVASINLAGMAVAFPVGVGLALALGVITTYIGNPQGDPLILFLGVVCVVIAIIFTAIAYGRVTQEADKSRRNKGLITAILAGIIMGWFFRFLADSMSDNFSQPASGLMTPYSALVLFAVGLFLSNFVLNRLVMKKPISGETGQRENVFFREFTGSCLRLAGRYDLVCRSGIQSDCVWSGGVCHFLRSGTGGHNDCRDLGSLHLERICQCASRNQ